MTLNMPWSCLDGHITTQQVPYNEDSEDVDDRRGPAGGQQHW